MIARLSGSSNQRHAIHAVIRIGNYAVGSINAAGSILAVSQQQKLFGAHISE